MRVVAILLILFAAAALPVDAVACNQDSVAAAAVAVFPDGTTLDLGKVRPSKNYKGEIRIANGGDSPLVIRRVFSDCGCTVADFPRGPIAPGDTAAIKITYNSGPRSIGPFVRTLRVETNTERRRNVVFVKGEVKR